MNLIHLIYASVMEKACSAPDIEHILETARRRNSGDHITGFLCFANGCFLQILEGDRQAVSDTFCRISQDPRHSKVLLLDCAPISSRHFPSWTMGYAGETKLNRTLFLRCSASDHFDPTRMSGESAYALLAALAGEQKNVQAKAA